jgi:hypothetical protein
LKRHRFQNRGTTIKGWDQMVLMNDTSSIWIAPLSVWLLWREANYLWLEIGCELLQLRGSILIVKLMSYVFPLLSVDLSVRSRFVWLLPRYDTEFSLRFIPFLKWLLSVDLSLTILIPGGKSVCYLTWNGSYCNFKEGLAHS